MKRRKAQERDEAIARAQADSRREHLLAELRSHQAPGGQAPQPEPEPAEPLAQAEPPEPEPLAQAEAESQPAPPAPESNGK